MQRKNFKIDSALYPEDIIIDTILVFQDFGFSYGNGELFIDGDSNEEIEEIFNEFMNYVLFLYNQK